MDTDKQKAAVLEHLKEAPVVQFACKKSGIGRATYYRWRTEDPEFAAAADKAIEEGIQTTNDLTELQLINLTRDRKMSAIAFWLRHNHPRYKQKLEVEMNASVHEVLSAEQEALIRKVLRITNNLHRKPYEPSRRKNCRKPHEG